MKKKVTKKAIMQNYTCISVGYCNLQTLLQYHNAQYYTCGYDGWHADIYIFGGYAIVTGYQPFGKIKADYDLCQKYELEAQKKKEKFIDNSETFEKLIDNFIKEVIKK